MNYPMSFNTPDQREIIECCREKCAWYRYDRNNEAYDCAIKTIASDIALLSLNIDRSAIYT